MERSRRCAHRAELVASRKIPADPAQRPGSEEGDGAVITAHSQDTAVRAQGLIDEPPASFADDADRGRAAEQRCQEVAARRKGVVKVGALAGQQQRAVERRLCERLSAEALGVCRGRLPTRVRTLAERERTCNGGEREHHERGQQGDTEPAIDAALPSACSAAPARLSSRNSRSTRFSSSPPPAPSTHSRAAPRRVPRRSSSGSRPPASHSAAAPLSRRRTRRP